MVTLEYKIPARRSANEKERRGLLVLSSQGLSFIGFMLIDRIDRKWCWKNVQWHIGVDIKTNFLSIKRDIPYVEFYCSNTDKVKLYPNAEDVDKLENVLNTLKSISENLEDEQRGNEVTVGENVDQRHNGADSHLPECPDVQVDYERFFCENEFYRTIQDRIKEAYFAGLSPVGKRMADFIIDYFKSFLLAKYKKHQFDEACYDEALCLLGEANIPAEITYIFSMVMEHAFYYEQYEVSTLFQVFETVLEMLGGGCFSDSDVNEDDYCWTNKQIISRINRGYTFTNGEINGVKSLNQYMTAAQGYIDLVERRLAEQNYLKRTVAQYVLSQARPVFKADLKALYPNCTKTILQSVGSFDGILDYQDRFVAYNTIRTSLRMDQELVRNLSSFLASQEKVCHVEQVFLNMRYANQFYLSNIFAETEQQLFSFLEVRFRKEFVFEYPFIALPGVQIVPPAAKLKNYVLGLEEISVENVQLFARENYINSNGVLELLVSLENEMYIKNREKLINAESVLLSDDDIEDIEALICEELENKHFCAVRELECVKEFPYCDIPYDEWFVYSILHKRGRVVTLQTTPGQFKYSLPVVSLDEEVCKGDLQLIAERYAGSLSVIVSHKVDNLDNLDDLIADVITLDDFNL